MDFNKKSDRIAIFFYASSFLCNRLFPTRSHADSGADDTSPEQGREAPGSTYTAQACRA